MRGVIKIPASIPFLSLKEVTVVLMPNIGVNNTYANPAEYDIATNEAIIGIDVVFDGVSQGEIQTLELTLVFDDNTQKSMEYSCTSEQLYCKYTLTPADIALYINSGVYAPGVYQKKIVKIVTRAKTTLSQPYGTSIVSIRALKVQNTYNKSMQYTQTPETTALDQ